MQSHHRGRRLLTLAMLAASLGGVAVAGAQQRPAATPTRQGTNLPDQAPKPQRELPPEAQAQLDEWSRTGQPPALPQYDPKTGGAMKEPDGSIKVVRPGDGPLPPDPPCATTATKCNDIVDKGKKK